MGRGTPSRSMMPSSPPPPPSTAGAGGEVTIQTCRWRRGYNPDLAFTSDRITCQCKKQVLEPIPHSQNRPSTIAISAAVVPQKVPLRRRFNFQKANWEQFARSLDLALLDLEPVPSNYDQFVKKVQETSRKYIPRGCREHYIPGISPDSASLYETYSKLYEEDPFSEDTMNAGETLMAAISESRRKSWQDLIESVDMTHNSKRAWSTIKKINNVPKKATLHSNVTADQVAHQLLLNMKPPHKTRHKRVTRRRGDTESTWQFTDEYLI